MPKPNDGWNDSKLIARAILHDRPTRRRWLGRMLLLPLLMLAVGLWGIAGWLDDSLLRFLAWWAVCALATFVVMMFALYDALATIREERGKHR